MEVIPVTPVWADRTTGPYQPGDVLTVKEPFRLEDGKAYYRADADPSDIFNYRWYTAAQMPVKYARIFLWIMEVSRLRMSQLTEEDACRCGYGSCQAGDRTFSTPMDAFLWEWKLTRISRYRRALDPEVWKIVFRVYIRE